MYTDICIVIARESGFYLRVFPLAILKDNGTSRRNLFIIANNVSLLILLYYIYIYIIYYYYDFYHDFI